MTLLNVDKLVMKHYIQYWGEPIEVNKLDWPQEGGLGGSFRIVKFVPQADEKRIYATVGLSAQAMPARLPTPNDAFEPRAELFIYADLETNSLIELLTALVVYPFENQTFLWTRQTILGKSPVTDHSKMTSVYITSPYFEEESFHSLHINDHHIQMLWIVPIYESEREYKIKYGWQALEELFEEKELDIWSLQRDPLV